MQDVQTRTIVKKLADFSDIRLGWVQRFHSVAHHKNLERAGVECCVTTTEVSESIQRLSAALCMPLVIPTTAQMPQLGKGFVSSAAEIVELASSIKRPFTNVRVAGLQALIAVSERHSYMAAARSLGWTRDRTMRGIDHLEEWIGEAIFHSGGLKFTDDGKQLLEAAQKIVAILERSRGRDTHEQHWIKRRRVKPWWMRTYGATADPPSHRHRYRSVSKGDLDNEP